MACARCGLLRSRWLTFNAQPASNPALDPLWEQALAGWDDPKRHSALVMVAGQDWTLLSALTQRYSAVLRQNPSDAIAQKAVDQLVHVAINLPVPTKGSGEIQLMQNVFKAGIGLLMMAAATYLFFAVLHR